ncbi:MAG TPA: DUF6799 domain-containing protein [Chthoniobacter sp.]|nr:DUF6799 domain-containing protein [Chthoniobacter sp.]
MKTLVSILCLSASLVTLASAQTTLNPNIPDPPQRAIPTGPRDGFFVRDNKVFMVQGGVTTQVVRETLFPNGLRVLPNATVTLRDGRETTLLPQQWLTFEGSVDDQIAAAPERPVAATETVARESGVSSRDGITVSGADVFITRNGATEKITADMRLSNGVIVHPDGTVLLANGKKITLRNAQVLDFHGVVHEAPVRANAPGIDPSLSNPSR